MSLPVIVVGAGGHARVLIEALRLCSTPILGIVDADIEKRDANLSGVPVIGNDDEILKYRPDEVALVNAVGSVKRTERRQKIFDRFKEAGYIFAVVIHPSAVIASDAVIEEGVQIMAGAIVQPGCVIGRNTIINTKASADHDCSIGCDVHLAPGVTLSGNVRIGNGTHVGTGSSVIQGITIGKNSVVGAGAAVIKDIPDNSVFTGVPAREVSK